MITWKQIKELERILPEMILVYLIFLWSKSGMLHLAALISLVISLMEGPSSRSIRIFVKWVKAKFMLLTNKCKNCSLSLSPSHVLNWTKNPFLTYQPFSCWHIWYSPVKHRSPFQIDSKNDVALSSDTLQEDLRAQGCMKNVLHSRKVKNSEWAISAHH